MEDVDNDLRRFYVAPVGHRKYQSTNSVNFPRRPEEMVTVFSNGGELCVSEMVLHTALQLQD